MEEEDISKLIITYAREFGASEKKLKSTISLSERLGVVGRVLSELVANHPHMFMASEEKVMKSFRIAEDLGFKLGSKKFVVAVHGTFNLAKETLEEKITVFEQFGFLKEKNFANDRSGSVYSVAFKRMVRSLTLSSDSVVHQQHGDQACLHMSAYRSE